MTRQGGTSVATCLILLLLAMAALARPSVARASTPECVDQGSSPVLRDSVWTTFSNGFSNFARIYADPSVLKIGDTYYMYFREILNETGDGIFRGTSYDGVNWTLDPTPVLTDGPAGSWDSNGVLEPDVLWNGTGLVMYYVGDGVIGNNNLTEFRQVGVAFSADGVHWTKYAGNPVIRHGPGYYDQHYTRGPSVVYGGGEYKMWYQGSAALNSTIPFLPTIEYATSPDGVHWTKYGGNPVFKGFLEPGYPTAAYYPSVVEVNGTYLMAFSDQGSNFGLATSIDGINWSFDNSSSVLLTLGGWHNGTILTPSMLLEGNRPLLWFAGYQNTTFTSPYVAGIGFASCNLFVVASSSTSTFTSISTVTVPSVTTVVSTLISTSIEVTTVTSNPGAPLSEALVSGVVGFALAAVIFAAAMIMRVKRGAP